MLDRIRDLLYHLWDVSCFINELYHDLDVDYDFYSNVLSCACIEEKFIMIELENSLNHLFNLDYNHNSFLSFLKLQNTFKVEMDWSNWHYCFELPNKVNKSSKEFILLKSIIVQVKKDTHDIDWFTESFEGEYKRLFRLQCRHSDFCTDDWLCDKNISVRFIE